MAYSDRVPRISDPVLRSIIALNIILAVVNIKGINFSANISKIFVLIQIVFIAVFCTVLGIQLWDSSGQMPSVLQTDVPLPVILTGASIICFSFLGFDSVTTMAEETIDAKKNIPRAIMIIILVAIVLYIGPSVLIQMSFPDMTFTDVDSADSNALTIGMIWVGLGVVYYAYRSHRLRAGADRTEAAPSGPVSTL